MDLLDRSWKRFRPCFTLLPSVYSPEFCKDICINRIMLTFREVSENDHDAICTLVRSREELFFVYPKGKFPLDSAQLAKLSNVRKELTVAVEGTRIVGFANLYNYRDHEYVFIGNLIVDADHRGKGIGRELVSYMLNKAFCEYDLPEVRISVFGHNAPALLLYSRFGFKPYEIEERKDPGGESVALIHMKMSTKG